MSAEIDYKSMRIAPIAILSLLLFMSLLDINVFVILLSSETGIQGIALLSSIDSLYYICEFLYITALIVVLVSLYRMHDISENYNYAWIIFVFQMIGDMLNQMIGIFTRLSENVLIMGVISGVFDMLPKLCVMIGVVTLLDVLTKMCSEMNGIGSNSVSVNEILPDAHIKNLKKTWIATELIRIALLFPLLVSMHIVVSAGTVMSGTLFGMVKILIGLSIVLLLIHIIISIIVFGKIRKVFRSYYLYRYNKGV